MLENEERLMQVELPSIRASRPQANHLSIPNTAIDAVALSNRESIGEPELKRKEK